ncbi:hypothetical protein [Methanimicrococcus hongohii]|uniref:hypothetical protein n=1 Tax=Methanimicrococcus hongohii TaxID=3028295 RepID=UPI002931059B|nr:hypothetical protein [Methanimicrococcus sp. Hf6]
MRLGGFFPYKTKNQKPLSLRFYFSVSACSFLRLSFTVAVPAVTANLQLFFAASAPAKRNNLQLSFNVAAANQVSARQPPAASRPAPDRQPPRASRSILQKIK